MCTSPQFEYKLHQVAEETGMSVIHTSPLHDGKMRGHSGKYRTNLDQNRPQKLTQGSSKRSPFPKAISTLFWRSSKYISIHTRAKAFPMQPRAVPIYKATHSSCSAMSAT